MSEWRAVPGYEGFYEATAEGAIRSVDRTVTNRPGVRIFKRGQELKPQINPQGYWVVVLCLNGKRREFYVHTVVLMTWVGARPEGFEACHCDGDKSNNSVANLRWDTRSANTLDKVAHGAHPFARRTHCPSGHAYDAANTYYAPGNKGRHCITCRNEKKRARRAAEKSAAA